jgi:hypothetical protein
MIRKVNGKWICYGEEMTREALLNRIGDMSQIAGIRLFELTNGNERGVRAAEFNTGSGFTFTVLLDRGMDIDQARYKGIPVSWQTPAGPVAPGFYQPEGLEWLYQFEGGLMASGGFTNIGAPNVDQGETLGLHGRASNIPAKDVCVKQEWQGDDYVMHVEGRIDEVALFKNSLRCHRRVETRMGESRLFIRDVVENIGFATSPLCILYHCNMGWPLVSKDSRVYIKSDVVGRTQQPPVELDKYNVLQEPTKGYTEQVFYHTPKPDADGMGNAALINPTFNNGEGYGVYVRWNLDTVPHMVHWKMMGQKAYVVGLEPANMFGDGRAAERAAGRLKFLEPGEKAAVNLEIGLLTTTAEIDDWLKKNS